MENNVSDTLAIFYEGRLDMQTTEKISPYFVTAHLDVERPSWTKPATFLSDLIWKCV